MQGLLLCKVWMNPDEHKAPDVGHVPLSPVQCSVWQLCLSLLGHLCSQVCWRSRWGLARCISQYPLNRLLCSSNLTELSACFQKPSSLWSTGKHPPLKFLSSFWLSESIGPCNTFIRTFIHLKLFLKCPLVPGIIFKPEGGSSEQVQQDSCSWGAPLELGKRGNKT